MSETNGQVPEHERPPVVQPVEEQVSGNENADKDAQRKSMGIENIFDFVDKRTGYCKACNESADKYDVKQGLYAEHVLRHDNLLTPEDKETLERLRR